MNQKILDLSQYKNGVTLNVKFDFTGQVAPFLIFITDQKGEIIYYNIVNKDQVSINLPGNPSTAFLNSPRPIKQILTSPLRIYPIKYNFNTGIITPRDYDIKNIVTQELPIIYQEQFDQQGKITGMKPSDQPARFLPEIGLKQVAQKILQTYPSPVRKFVVTHEDGHYYYGRPLPPRKEWNKYSAADQKNIMQVLTEDEKEADRYAAYKLINEGHNFSSMVRSIKDFLDDNVISRDRIGSLINTLKKEQEQYMQHEWN